MTTFVVVVCAVTLGYALKGATGFAEAVPVAVLGPFVLPLPEVVTLITFMDLFAGIVILPSARVPIFVRSEWRRTVAVCGGTLMGITALRNAPTLMVRTVVIVVLAGTAAWVVQQAINALGVNRRVLAARIEGRLHLQFAPQGAVVARRFVNRFRSEVGRLHLTNRLVVGQRFRTGAGCVVAGLTGGMSGLDGPPMYAALSTRGAHPHTVRDQVMRLLLLSAILRLVLLTGFGNVHRAILGLSVTLVPVAAVAFLIGRSMSRTWTPATSASVSAGVCLVGVILALVS